MNDAQSDDAVERQTNPRSSPANVPLIGFVLICVVAAFLVPPAPPAADAGPIETWTTFVLANALIFCVVFGVLVLLFWTVARIVNRRPTPATRYFGNATVVSTVLMLLMVVAQWYGRHRAGL